MKKDKKNFIEDLLEDESTAKNANIKAYMFMKKSKSISVSDTTLDRMHNCGKVVKYALDTVNEKKKLLYTETCESRFCARCQKMKSIKLGQKLFTLTNYLKVEKEYRFLFITLTVPNVSKDDLKEEIKEINSAIDKMTQRKKFQQFKAYFTKLEITYNRKRNDCHPHIHLLVAVEKNYFDKRNKDYITQGELLKHWQSAKEDYSITQVDVRALKDNDDKKLMKSILELSKYEAKSSDFAINQEVFETFYFALKGARMTRFNREYRTLGKIYDVDKYGIFEDYQLEIDECGEFTCKSISHWQFKTKEYFTNFENLTELEIRFLKQKNEVQSYKQFLRTWKKVVKEKLDSEDKLFMLNERLKKQELSKKRIRIESTKEKIKNTKATIARRKVLIELYEKLDTEFKSEFQK